MRSLLALSRGIDLALAKIADFTGWFMLVLMTVIIADVITRKAGFQFPYFTSTRLQELEWHLHTIIFCGWMGYNYVINAHPRVDSMTSALDLRRKAWIEVIGCLIFAFPYCYVCVYYAIPFLVTAYEIGESSDAPNGLPFRWVLKGIFVAGIVLIPLGVLSMFIKSFVYLFGGAAAREVTLPLDSARIDV